MIDNPYEPPSETVELATRANNGRAPDLLKASKYLTRMRLCSMLYFGPASVITLTIAAYRLPQYPDKYLRKSRWLAILLGTFFFPFFTWPAYAAAKQLTLYDRN